MTISVVIPAYNEERFLPATLDAIRLQTRKTDELIVIDASSTDNTAAIASSHGAKVIQVIKKTIGESRQIGLESASGDVVVFTDADTIVPVNWLEDIEHMIAAPHVVGVFGGFRVPDGPWWFKLYINILQPRINTLLWRIFRFPMATGQYIAFYKDKGLAAGGFPKDFRLAEDVEFARRLMRVGPIIFRQDSYVLASGRRGYEGFFPLALRISKAFLFYLLFGRADKIGFPDIRKPVA